MKTWQVKVLPNSESGMTVWLGCQWAGDGDLPNKLHTRGEIHRTRAQASLEVSKTEHTITPVFSDSTKSTLPTA
jgi:hypothetical protein